MYVKVPMTLKITIKNPSRTAMRLKTCLKNSESFMFSGNTQVGDIILSLLLLYTYSLLIFIFCLYVQLNISIYSYSSYELSFNLYPLKAGWQDLPEFEIKYNTQHDDTIGVPTMPLVKPLEIDDLDEMANLELQSLVTRWMPKRVFILVKFKRENHINVNICAFDC